MQILRREKGKTEALATCELKAGVRVLGNAIALKILQALALEEQYPKQLARKLKMHEQNVYYYIHQLEKAGAVKVVKQERLQGTIAKWYAPVSDSFFVRVGEFKEHRKLEEQKSRFLQPFISDGSLNALLVVGSPDPHGPLKARSRDGYFGMDLALFLGTFLHRVEESKVKLDTEVHEQNLRQNNLIVLGGPIVNKIAEGIGEHAPIYFDEQKKGFYSKLSKRLYVHEEVGVIVKCKSPWNKEKQILFVAGIRNAGTKAAILAFLQQLDELEKGNRFDREVFCKVVEGVDLDSDGQIDSVEILE